VKISGDLTVEDNPSLTNSISSVDIDVSYPRSVCNVKSSCNVIGIWKELGRVTSWGYSKGHLIIGLNPYEVADFQSVC